MAKKKQVAVNGATGLLSIRQAARLGIDRLRQPNWVNPLDHVKIDLQPNGLFGPWAHLYAPFNIHCNGRDPVDMLMIAGQFDLDAEGLEPYKGPLPDSAEYKADIAKYAIPTARDAEVKQP